RANTGYRVPQPPFGRATLLSSTHTVSVTTGLPGSVRSYQDSSALALAAPHPDDSTTFDSPVSTMAAWMPRGPVKKLTVRTSVPGGLNRPAKKSATPAPPGLVELPTATSADN